MATRPRQMLTSWSSGSESFREGAWSCEWLWFAIMACNQHNNSKCLSKCWHPCMLYVPPTLTQTAASHTCTFLRGKLAVSGVVEQLICRFELIYKYKAEECKTLESTSYYVNELKTLLYLLFYLSLKLERFWRMEFQINGIGGWKIEVFNV